MPRGDVKFDKHIEGDEEPTDHDHNNEHDNDNDHNEHHEPAVNNGHSLGSLGESSHNTTLTDTDAVLKFDVGDANADFDLDSDLHMESDPIFPSGKTSSTLVANVAAKVQASAHNYTVKEMRESNEKRYNAIANLARQHEDVGVFAKKRLAVLEKEGSGWSKVWETGPDAGKYVYRGTDEVAKEMGRELFEGVRDGDPNAVQKFYNRTSKIKLDSETKDSDGAPGRVLKSKAEFESSFSDPKAAKTKRGDNETKRWKVSNDALEHARALARKDIAKEVDDVVIKTIQGGAKITYLYDI